MSQSRYLIVNQAEWERLKKQASPPEETTPQQQHNEYLPGLIQKSQEWIRTWPDSLQAVVNKVEERIEKKRQKELDMIEAIKKIDSKRVRYKIKSREEAKERIFYDTGYGRQLLSALIESKTLEERDAQVQFQKEIKQKAIEQQAKDPNRANCSLKLNRDDDEEMRQRKQKNKEIAAINKNMHKMKKQKTSEESAKEKLLELEDARLMKQLLEAEAHGNDKCEKMEIKAAREFEAEQKTFFENKAKRDLVDNSLIKLWHDYHDKVQCKSKKIFKKLHKGREDTENMKKTYDQLQILHDIEKKSYEEFIMKGVQKFEDELNKNDELLNEQEKKKHENLVQIAQNNKRIAAEKEEIKRCSNKCGCDRQSLFTMPGKIHKKKKPIGEDLLEKPFLSFLAQPNKLHEELKKRAKEPTPWNALKASHEFFARKAGETLAECKYKNVARKVVDEYRKTNCVDSTTLPVSNY